MSILDSVTLKNIDKRLLDSIKDSVKTALPKVAIAKGVALGSEFLHSFFKYPSFDAAKVLGVSEEIVKTRSIENFKYYFKDFARANLFEVMFFTEFDNMFLTKSCKSIDIPGVTFNETVIDHRKFVTGLDLDSVSLTFNVDNEGKILKYFETWSNKIYNKETHTYGFKDEYAYPIIISLYQRNGNIFGYIKFDNAYPTNISSIPLSWDTDNTILELTVAFNFDTYFSEFI